MQASTFIRTVRTNLDTVISESQRQEYKAEVIIKQFKERMKNVRELVLKQITNRKEQQKYLKVLNDCNVQYKDKHYDLIVMDFKELKTKLPYMIDFIKL